LIFLYPDAAKQYSSSNCSEKIQVALLFGDKESIQSFVVDSWELLVTRLSVPLPNKQVSVVGSNRNCELPFFKQATEHSPRTLKITKTSDKLKA
jgi:galactokinase